MSLKTRIAAVTTALFTAACAGPTVKTSEALDNLPLKVVTDPKTGCTYVKDETKPNESRPCISR